MPKERQRGLEKYVLSPELRKHSVSEKLLVVSRLECRLHVELLLNIMLQSQRLGHEDLFI